MFTERKAVSRQNHRALLPTPLKPLLHTLYIRNVGRMNIRALFKDNVIFVTLKLMFYHVKEKCKVSNINQRTI